jgi:hypothetical protein
MKPTNVALVALLVVIVGAGLGMTGHLDGVGGWFDRATRGSSDVTPAKVNLPAIRSEATPAKVTSTVTRTPASKPVVRRPYEPGGLRAIAAQLVARLGYQPRLLEVLLSEEYAQFQVQDPRHPAKVDEYTWRDGEFSGPEPVHVSTTEPLAPKLFSLRAINLDAPAALARRAKAVRIEGATPSTTIIQNTLPFRPGVSFYVNVSGTRESRQLRADARGRVYDVV